jgi:hypothetical protein
MSKVKSLISSEIMSKKGIITVRYLKQKISKDLNLDIPASKVRKILTKDMKLKWKKVKNQP